MHVPIKSLVICIVFSLLAGCGSVSDSPRSVDGSTVSKAFEHRKSDVQVEDEGVVTRILSDDRQGSPHQRFIVKLASGQTVLIQHNIELAPRVSGIKEGDTVSFLGEYIWNDQGGLVHWTHRDPGGKHVDGWVRHNGRTYQ
jgi:hypothetical protein